MAEAAGQEETGITYSAVLTPGEDGWFCAQIAEVPEAISQGRTFEEAKVQRRRGARAGARRAPRRGRGDPRARPVIVTPVTVSGW